MIVRCRRMIDNDEWESLAGKEERKILFSYWLTQVIYIADKSHPYS